MKKTLGILGGMGPQASLDFYKMLIENTEKKNGENTKNEDFPNIFLANIPVPDLIKGPDGKEQTIQMVRDAAMKLEKIRVDFLVMPCNTMHLFQDEILQDIHIPFVSMIESVVQYVVQSGVKKIGLLASATTLASGLYTEPLREAEIICIIPEKSTHQNISIIIQKYISGNISPSDISTLERYCGALIEHGAEGIILGCTELPLILSGSNEKYNFFASSKILAERATQYLEI